MHRAIPFVLVLLLVVGGIFFLLPGEQGPMPEQGDAATSGQSSAIAPAPVEDGPEQAADLSRDAQESREDLSTDIAALPSPQFEGPGLQLLALQYGTDVPVADALVLLGDKGWIPKPEDSLEENLRDSGLAYRTDAEGLLRFPMSWIGRTVGVRADGLWGSTPIERPTYGDVIRVRIAPDRSVQVTVLDQEDQGVAGVPVGLFGSPHGGIQLQRQAITDAQGVAVIRLAGDPALRDWGTHKFWVDTVTPKAQPPHETYPLAELPQRVLLRVDRPASLVIQLQDLEGEPCRRPVAVTLVRAESNGKAAGRKNPSIEMLGETSDKDGTVRFRGLEHGVPMVAQAFFLGDREAEELLLEPFEPGEHRSVEIRQSKGQPVLHLRLVDEQQKPLVDLPAESALYSILPNYPVFPQLGQHRTDAEGRIRITLADGSLIKDGFRLKERRLELRHKDAVHGLVLSGKVDLYREFSAEDHDLGDVALINQPILAAGMVVDEHGVPAADVRVTMQLAAVTVGENLTSIGTPHRVGREARTDDQGYFRFHGVAEEGEYSLTAHGKDQVKATVEMEVLGEAHNIVLHTGHILAGRIRLPDELQAKRASVVFFRPTEQDPEAQVWALGVSDRYGNFKLAGLDATPGLVAVTLGMSYPSQHLLEFTQVVPWIPGTPVDPRLLEIDLRDAFRSFHVRAIDATGTPLPDAQFIQFKKTGSGSSWSTSDSLDGSFTYHAVESNLKITIKAPGFHPRQVELVEPETDVEMTPAAEGVFLVDRMPELQSNQGVILDLDPIGFDIGGFRLEPDQFDAEGRLETFLPPPGRYHINLGIRTSSPGSWSSTDEPVLDAAGNRVEILIDEKGEAPTFRIAVPEEFYTRMLPSR